MKSLTPARERVMIQQLRCLAIPERVRFMMLYAEVMEEVFERESGSGSSVLGSDVGTLDCHDPEK